MDNLMFRKRFSGEVPSLAILQLKCAGLLKRGTNERSLVLSGWFKVLIKTQIDDEGYGFCRFCYLNPYTNEPSEPKAWIIQTECHVGKTRQWFQCPGCGSAVDETRGRSGTLFFNGEQFLCRKCSGVSYRRKKSSRG